MTLVIPRSKPSDETFPHYRTLVRYVLAHHRALLLPTLLRAHGVSATGHRAVRGGAVARRQARRAVQHGHREAGEAECAAVLRGVCSCFESKSPAK